MLRSKTKQFLTMTAAAFLLAAVVVFPACTAAVSHAAEDVVADFEAQNVWADLQNSVIAGEPFDIMDYPKNTSIDPSVITFAEMGYSYDVNNQDDFGLYLYIYNPKECAYDVTRNRVQLKCGSLATANYSLTFLNYCSEKGYEGRFYKYRIELGDARQEMLRNLNEHARSYTVVSFELSRSGVSESYTCAQTYTYSGYAAGYGSEPDGESTLTCAVDGFERYVELDVHQTVYRAQGDFYEGQQSQLNSCYFRVPGKYFTDYGDLTKIVAEWYEYLTNPILVTETDYLYQRLYALHGGDVHAFSPATDFLIYSTSNKDTSWLGGKSKGLGWASDVDTYEDDYYFVFGDGLRDLGIKGMASGNMRFDSFAAVFYTGQNISYTERSVTSSELENQLLLNSDSLGGPYYGGRYSSALFTEYVNDGHVRGYNQKTIHKDDIKDIWWNITTKDFWQTAFGGYAVETIYDGVKAIVTSADKDFDLSGSDADIAERLKIGIGDVPGLKAECAKAERLGERLVLLRYGESTYYSIPCVESYCSSSEDDIDETLVKDSLVKWSRDEFSAYIAQETVYLDFDIISLWFKADGGAETEVPVVMSPQDVISPLDTPLDENYHNGQWKDAWTIILAVLLLILLVALLWPVMPYIVKAVVWVVLLPFRLIKMIVDACKKPKSNAEAPPDAEKLKEKKTKAEKKR